MKKRVPFMTVGIALALVSAFMLFTPVVLHAASPLVPPATGNYVLDDFLVLVDDQLVLKGPAKVNCCLNEAAGFRSDLGSRSTITLGGTATTAVPSDAPTIEDVAVIAPTVVLNSFAKVSQTITATAASLIKSGSGIVGPTAATVDPRLPGDLPAFPQFAPPSGLITVGTNDIVVPASGTANITPTSAVINGTTTVNGPFRDLIIGANATVNFTTSPATYQFRRIIANTASHYSIVLAGAGIQVNVLEFVRLAEFGDINPSNQPQFTIYVQGSDGSYAGANKNKNGVTRPGGAFPAAFEYDGDGTFNACFVFVKNGTANIRGITTYSTQWFGNSLQEIGNLSITLQSPGQVCHEVVSPCPCCPQCP